MKAYTGITTQEEMDALLARVGFAPFVFSTYDGLSGRQVIFQICGSCGYLCVRFTASNFFKIPQASSSNGSSLIHGRHEAS
jgi:hypothetical protein